MTDAEARALKPDETGRRRVLWDDRPRGLCLRVTGAGVKTWSVWFRLGDGRQERITLGRYPVLPLADARKRALAVLRDVALGRNPAEDRRVARRAGTFGQLVDTFLADAQIRPSTLAEWKRLLSADRLAELRRRRTPEISRRELTRLFERIRADSLREGGKGYAANRTLEAVRRTFTWAMQRGLIDASPCVGVTKPTREAPRRRSYTDAELGRIARALRADGSAFAAVCTLALYTGTRVGAALGARWDEADLDAATWRIPGDRAGVKNGLDWLVPLPEPAVALLKARPRGGEWIFGIDGPATHQSKVLARIGRRAEVADFRIHDLRRCVNSWLASMAGGAVPLEVRDAVLGHKPRGLEGVYNIYGYEKEKKAALARWARHVERCASAEPAKVLAMPGVVA